MTKPVLLAFVGLLAVSACHRTETASSTPTPAPVPASPPAASAPGTTDGSASAAASAALKSTRDGGSDGAVARTPIDDAMARFGAAVVAKDPAGVLAWFSKTKPFTFVSGGPDGHIRKLRFDYAAVSKGIQPHGDFHDFFFGDDSELLDAFERSRNWSRVRGNLFVPPGNETKPEDASTAVRWRREGNGYVIDQLFDEGA